MASGEEDSPRGKRKKITAFLVDKGTPGLHRARGLPQRLASRLHQRDPRIRRLPAAQASQVLGEVHKGFEVANSWLGATRLAGRRAPASGRAERALGHAVDYAAQREQFGQQIGKFQGVSFKLADMATEIEGGRPDGVRGRLEIPIRARPPTRTWPWPS